MSPRTPSRRPSPAGGTELASRVRADDRLVSLGLASTRAEAAALILAGRVLDGTRRVEKAGESVKPDAALALRARRRFVSRGGEKLEAALAGFGVDVSGRVCVDAGCSTGGFTDCLLQRGAARVYAIDVGYGQFAWSLRRDPRVVLHERTNVRALDARLLVPPASVVVADLSFVSLTAVLPSLLLLAGEPDADFVLLVKPQFEVAAADLAGGVVSSEVARTEALAGVEAAVRAAGLEVAGTMRSPLEGADGNVEYLLRARRRARGGSTRGGAPLD